MCVKCVRILSLCQEKFGKPSVPPHRRTNYSWLKQTKITLVRSRFYDQSRGALYAIAVGYLIKTKLLT